MKKINKAEKENKILWAVINDIIWMAIRYAHGRHTYTPLMVRDNVKILQLLNKDFKLKRDITIEAPEHECSGMNFRDDYLDDLFIEE